MFIKFWIQYLILVCSTKKNTVQNRNTLLIPLYQSHETNLVIVHLNSEIPK